jgi:glycosyltransferase involved in cell wall biosynthesis
MKPVAIVIPAYKPGGQLVEVLGELLERRDPEVVARILVCNDGSGPEYAPVFEQVRNLPGVTVIGHAVNRGKGAALKTAFNHVLMEFPEIGAIVTADADGQHRPADILRVATAACQDNNRLYLGVREFGSNTPARSKFGNEVTRKVMWLFTGLHLKDTQTGLRGLPVDVCRDALRLSSNGYEFEMDMIVSVHTSRKRHTAIVEIPIETVYEVGNPTSHFNPVLDSMRVYFVFIRYCGASLFTFITDYLVFLLALVGTSSLVSSMFLGRGAATVVSYYLNRRFVFSSGSRFSTEFLKFLATVVALATVAYYGIVSLTEQFGVNVFAAKLLIESLLFFASFSIMNTFVFPKKRPD